jgi:hypothetical protein
MFHIYLRIPIFSLISHISPYFQKCAIMLKFTYICTHLHPNLHTYLKLLTFLVHVQIFSKFATFGDICVCLPHLSMVFTCHNLFKVSRMYLHIPHMYSNLPMCAKLFPTFAKIVTQLPKLASLLEICLHCLLHRPKSVTFRPRKITVRAVQ